VSAGVTECSVGLSVSGCAGLTECCVSLSDVKSEGATELTECCISFLLASLQVQLNELNAVLVSQLAGLQV